jgi:hypothetical protein
MFWKKPKMLEESKDFRFVDFKDSDITGIELLLTEFRGLVYHYNEVKLLEENGQAKLQFGYNIVHTGENQLEDLQSDEKLHIIMGDLLTYILMNKAEDEIRNNDNQEPDIL